MNYFKYIVLIVILASCLTAFFIGCEKDDIIRYQATGSMSLDIVNGTAQTNWPSEFSAHITITEYEGEEMGEGFDPIETDVTIKRDSQDSTRWAAAELVEVPVEVYISVSIRANIAGQTWGNANPIVFSLNDGETKTMEVELSLISSNQYVQDFNSGSLPSDWVFDGDPLEFTASVMDGELHLNAFADYGTGTAIINRFFNDISHIGYNIRIENNSIEAWGIGCQVANEYASGGFIIGRDIAGVIKAYLVEGDGISIFMLDSTLINFDLNTDYAIDFSKSGAVVTLVIDGNTIMEYSGAGTLDTSIVFFTTSYCNQIIDNVVIDHAGEIIEPGSNNNPPYAPSSPSPASGSIGVNPTEVNLSWTGGDPDGDYVYYTLNWGSDSSMNNYEYMESENYTLYELQPATTYAWQVTSEDDYGEITVGPVWTFTSGVDTGGTSFVQWEHTLGGSEEEHGKCVQQTSDGGYIIAGYTESYGAVNGDVLLIKTDAVGNEIWNQNIGGSNNDYGNCIRQTSDGGYIIAGFTQSYGAGGKDVYLIKTDANGNEVWSRTFGGSDDDYGQSVQQTFDGGYIITGTYGESAYFDRDVYLIKTDAGGNEMWSRTFGGNEYSDNDSGYGVLQTSDGGYIIAGGTTFYGAGNWDIWLIKTDSDGNEIWNQTFGGAAYDVGYSVQQTSDGGFIIAGTSTSYNPGTYEFDFYLVKTDASGNEEWYQTFHLNSNDYCRSVQQTYDGGYILAGETGSNSDGWDVYLIKTDTGGNEVWNQSFDRSNYDYGRSVEQTYDGGYIIAGDCFDSGDWDVWLLKVSNP